VLGNGAQCQFSAIQADGVDAQAHLADAGRRNLDIFDPEHFRTAEFMDADLASHGVGPSSE
jgi:hypothetical protein